ncbi:hypothetical protein PR048_026841 [Dryococelus australis]|uniref:Uncharacterized protein n=1 Tax=Dryococelus australis TaxID=614101 RepID=A0ABQ9GMH7_9NEOP|nr:hypothetical protein PR048_026841 [Dryococelus australis]
MSSVGSYVPPALNWMEERLDGVPRSCLWWMDIQQYQVAHLFAEAYVKVATNHNAISGFANTVIKPMNTNIFSDFVFSPAAATDEP